MTSSTNIYPSRHVGGPPILVTFPRSALLRARLLSVILPDGLCQYVIDESPVTTRRPCTFRNYSTTSGSIRRGQWTSEAAEVWHNQPRPRPPLAVDTPPEIEAMQIEGWRRMTAAEKAGIVIGLTRAMFDLTLAGVGHRYPAASEREQFL